MHSNGFIWMFKDIEEKLEINKKEAQEIFKILKLAKIFDYVIVPYAIEHDDDYKDDPFPPIKEYRQIIENRDECFIIFGEQKKGPILKDSSVAEAIIKLIPNCTFPIIGSDFKKIKELSNSEEKLNSFLKKYGKYIKIDIPKQHNNKVGNLILNLETGEFNYMGVKGHFSPTTQEYKILSQLFINKDNTSNYSSLIKKINLSYEEVTKINKFYVHTVIRNIKERLKILPKTKKSKPDCIKNIKGFGYKLLTK